MTEARANSPTRRSRRILVSLFDRLPQVMTEPSNFLEICCSGALQANFLALFIQIRWFRHDSPPDTGHAWEAVDKMKRIKKISVILTRRRVVHITSAVTPGAKIQADAREPKQPIEEPPVPLPSKRPC